MKKKLASFLFMLILPLIVFAETVSSDTSFKISAYKPELNTSNDGFNLYIINTYEKTGGPSQSGKYIVNGDEVSFNLDDLPAKRTYSIPLFDIVFDGAASEDRDYDITIYLSGFINKENSAVVYDVRYLTSRKYYDETWSTQLNVEQGYSEKFFNVGDDDAKAESGEGEKDKTIEVGISHNVSHDSVKCIISVSAQWGYDKKPAYTEFVGKSFYCPIDVVFTQEGK